VTVEFPGEVHLALLILMRHVQPGWESSTAVVREWLEQLEPELEEAWK
jgi:hypothetical protein